MGQMTNQLALRALESFENLVRDTLVTKAGEKSRHELDMAKFLFQSEYQQQVTNIEKINQLGIALPDHLRTDNYQFFAENAGDKNVMESLGALYAQAKMTNQEVNQLINQYSQGVALADSLYKQGFAADTSGAYGPKEGPMDTGYYQFSPEEILGLEEDYPGLENAAYRKGFEAGNVDLTKALDNVKNVTQIYSLKRSIQDADFKSAKLQHNELINSSGLDVIANVAAMLEIPLEAMGGARGMTDDKTRINMMSQIELIEQKLRSSTDISNVSGEIIAAINNYAGSDFDVSDFNDLAAKAYRLTMENTAKEEEYIALNKMELNEVNIQQAKTDLMQSDKDYADNTKLLIEYGLAGIIGDTRLMQQAFLIDDMGDKITEGGIVMGSQTAARFGDVDFPMFEELLEEYDPLEGIEINLQEHNKIKDAWNRTGAGSLELEGGSELTRLIGEIETQESQVTTAMGNFRIAGQQLRSLWPELGPEKWGDRAINLTSTDIGGVLVDKLPSYERMEELRNQLRVLIDSVEKSQPLQGIFDTPESGEIAKAKKINFILNTWNNYKDSWDIASREKGEIHELAGQLGLGE